MEAMKTYQRKIEKMMDARPKLFGLILRDMSLEGKDEVVQDPDYDVLSEATDPEKLWQVIVKTHKIDCVTSVDTVKELAAGKAYQSIKQGPFETLAQYSERIRETYGAYKATEKDPVDAPIDVKEPDQAMDFLQNMKYRWVM
jgi:hypothetical protein